MVGVTGSDDHAVAIKEDDNMSQDQMHPKLLTCFSHVIPMFPDDQALVYTKLKTRGWVRTNMKLFGE